MTDEAEIEVPSDSRIGGGLLRNRPSSNRRDRPPGILLITDRDLPPVPSSPVDKDNSIKRINPMFSKDAPYKHVTHSELHDAIQRLKPVKPTDANVNETEGSPGQTSQKDDMGDNIQTMVDHQQPAKLPVFNQKQPMVNISLTPPCSEKGTQRSKETDGVGDETENKHCSYPHGKTPKLETQGSKIYDTHIPRNENEKGNKSFCNQTVSVNVENPDNSDANYDTVQETSNESMYATIADVIRRKESKPFVPTQKSTKSNSLPDIIVPESISNIETLSVNVPKNLPYVPMISKTPLPLPPPPRNDLSDINLPTIETNYDELAFRYEDFLSHINHESDPFIANFTQDNFSAALFKEEGGILNVNGAHLTIPNGAIKTPTVLFLYCAGNDCEDIEQHGGLSMQYQVSPVIICGPKTAFDECIFLTLNKYEIDDSEWTCSPQSRGSDETSKWAPIKDSDISIQQGNRWVYALESLRGLTEFKLVGYPIRRAQDDSDGMYDVPIDHYITVQMSAVIDDSKNTELLTITMRKVAKTDPTNSTIQKETTFLLSQLGGEFLLMKIFGENEKIHIGSMICGRQSFIECSFKLPSTGRRNLPIELRQELKKKSFQLNIIRKDSLTNKLQDGATQWVKDIRIFCTLLSQNRFKKIKECAEPDHWAQFCKLAFQFSDAQADHFRKLPYCRSLAINLYMAINDTCGNTLQVLTPLRILLEKADIFQAPSIVEGEIKELLSLCETSDGYIPEDSGSDDNGDYESDNEIDSMYASILERRASMP
ncbi:uncharacterized protein LOC117107817 [Anneissia japonica]|uniref:uncharacterized protein LOC117107817 n=1 Tax=Anneissia japonica TaxID=1529436 RepID=UPI0014259BC0|nr:uncharacterized protein LOC117107817 [Anneissia japonica]